MANIFAGDINSFNLITIQNWTGEPLRGMEFKNSYEELTDCREKIIFVEAREANYKFDITKQLIENNNYLVLIEVGEIIGSSIAGLCQDLPAAEQFPRIIGGSSSEWINDNGQKVVDDKRKKDFNLDSFYFFTHSDTNILKAVDYTLPDYLNKKSKPYKFLFLNGVHRPHRERLWKSLEQKNLLSTSLCSYLNFHVPKSNFEACTVTPTVLPREYDTTYSGVDSMPRLRDDDRNWKVFKHDYWKNQWVDGHIIPPQYTDTYFTVVTETCTDKVFLTEKIFKPLLAGHPFLALAAPGFYEYLHHLGFKTFDGIIDERFAYESVLDKRIKMLAQEIERLCKSDLDWFLEKVRPICEHNQSHYVNGRQKFFKEKHHALQAFVKTVEQDARIYFKQRGSNGNI